jgi:hypothetical protein
MTTNPWGDRRVLASRSGSALTMTNLSSFRLVCGSPGRKVNRNVAPSRMCAGHSRGFPPGLRGHDHRPNPDRHRQRDRERDTPTNKRVLTPTSSSVGY